MHGDMYAVAISVSGSIRWSRRRLIFTTYSIIVTVESVWIRPYNFEISRFNILAIQIWWWREYTIPWIGRVTIFNFWIASASFIIVVFFKTCWTLLVWDALTFSIQQKPWWTITRLIWTTYFLFRMEQTTIVRSWGWA